MDSESQNINTFDNHLNSGAGIISENYAKILKELAKKYNVKIFKKTNNIINLRDCKKIIDDCLKLKRKKIIDLSNELKNMANEDIIINKVKEIQDKTNNEIIDIDNIISIVTHNIKNTECYIEIYEN